MKPADRPSVEHGRIGVLLINLGTPDAPEPAAVRRYLAEFLSDPRVIEIPRIAWLPILHGIILRTRPRKSARAYKQVWTEEGSPLAAITRRQAEGLQQRLGENVIVDFAMRYGNPGIGKSIENLASLGCERILAAPLYPQHCAATTASAVDAVFGKLASMRRQPALRTLPPYYDDPRHIDALKGSIERQLAPLDFEPQRLLLSFHGMPERTRQLGDPYHDQCQETARLLGQTLSIPTDIAFQSRFGRAKWLEPATDKVLSAYPEQGVRRIAIAAPGFSADCVETVEELGIRGRATFLKNGGEAFARLECLNDSPEGMNMLEALVSRELAGWLLAP
ncbi:MAG TPA: ferrochelatase [Sphingomicrobium sp.]|nr:ferrochelatase [Sphingomicrobium sp.]